MMACCSMGPTEWNLRVGCKLFETVAGLLKWGDRLLTMVQMALGAWLDLPRKPVASRLGSWWPLEAILRGV